MPSGGLLTNPIAPVSIIIPYAHRLSGAAYYEYATTGAMVMSGANLYVYNGTAWEIVGTQT